MNLKTIGGSFSMSSTQNRTHGRLIETMKLQLGEHGFSRLMAFKASEFKTDPERRLGLHGPYEELVIQSTGKLPEGYYDNDDPSPWGLRLDESRANILWQVLSGMLDHRPEFGAAYMGLVLDNTLDVVSYSKELNGIHKDWARVLLSAPISGHQHQSLKGVYQSVSCAACSVLTAMVCADEKMNRLFQSIVKMKPREREAFLEDQGFATLINIMIPKDLILNQNHLNN